jgi:hypothetical protein
VTSHTGGDFAVTPPELGSVEQLSVGSDKVGRPHKLLDLIVVALAVLALFGWWVTRPAASTTVAQHPVPVASTSIPSEATSNNGQPVLDPGIVTKSIFLRADATQHIALVLITLASGDGSAMQFTKIRSQGANGPTAYGILSAVTAQQFLAQPVRSATATLGPVSMFRGAALPRAGLLALAIAVMPTCFSGLPVNTPTLTLVYSPTGTTEPVLFTVPAMINSAQDWFAQAVLAACGLVRPLNVRIVSSRLSGLDMTTIGPQNPPAGMPFTVSVTASNSTTKPFVGAIGALMFDRAKLPGPGAPLPSTGLDLVELSAPQEVTSWQISGRVAGSTVELGFGAARRQQRIEPGHWVKVSFLFLFRPARDLLGPAAGWIPLLVTATGETSYADPETYPQINRPKF